MSIDKRLNSCRVVLFIMKYLNIGLKFGRNCYRWWLHSSATKEYVWIFVNCQQTWLVLGRLLVDLRFLAWRVLLGLEIGVRWSRSLTPPGSVLPRYM